MDLVEEGIVDKHDEHKTTKVEKVEEVIAAKTEEPATEDLTTT